MLKNSKYQVVLSLIFLFYLYLGRLPPLPFARTGVVPLITISAWGTMEVSFWLSNFKLDGTIFAKKLNMNFFLPLQTSRKREMLQVFSVSHLI